MPLDQQVIDNFERIINHLAGDLKGIKTGRAKPSLVEDIRVEAYGTKMTIKEVASITAPDPGQIIVSPWDKSLTEAIAKAINSSGLNLNGVVDGELVRIKIPSLTEETRQQLVKLVGQKVESAKVMIRQARQESKREIEAKKDAGGVSEDEIHQDLENLQKKVEDYEAKLESMGSAKQQELQSF